MYLCFYLFCHALNNFICFCVNFLCRCADKELAVFLKYNYTQDFDEREIDYYEPDEYLNYIMPDTVEFKLNKAYIDGKVCHLYSVRDYPLSVKNAWGYQIFNIPGTKVTMNIIKI